MNRTLSIIKVFALLILISSCKQVTQDNPKVITTTYGTYTIPGDWVKLNQISTSRKSFYVNFESQKSETPTNISVEIGSNRYSLSELGTFKLAIARQLAMQGSSSPEDNGISGSGTFTQNEYPLLIYKIGGPDYTTVQFYIVGEKKHVLIHLTEYSNDVTNVEAIAKEIADSFIWSDS